MRLNWLNYKFIHEDGYGTYGRQFVRALARLGVDVRPAIKAALDMPGDLLRMAGFDFSCLTVALMPPHEMVPLPGRQIGYTMYEATRLRRGWAAQLNALCERVLVPAPWLVEVMDSHQVKVPVHVVSGGIDPAEFPVMQRHTDHRPYTFLALGDRGSRKGWDIVWQAFYAAFGDNRDVRLIIKTRAGDRASYNGRVSIDLSHSDSRLSFWRADVATMADVYAQVDCFVFPTRAEGWGLPPREAAATGLPVIAPRHTGTAVGIDHWALPLERFTWVNANVEAEPSPDGTPAQWARCDADEVAERMHWCYEHQDEARAHGLRAAEWLRAHQTWEHAARALVELLTNGSEP